MLILKILLWFVVTTVYCEDTEERPVERSAVFTTTPLNSMVNEGDTIRLPCFVDRIEGYVLLWKYGETILSVGGRIIELNERHERIELEEETNGNYLVISDARSEDSGSYVCQISDFVPRDIKHNVIVRTQPRVRVVTSGLTQVSSGVLELTQGDNVTLTCAVVSGHPRPELSWSTPGAGVVYNDTLSVASVTREHSGVYQCRGDNGHPRDHTDHVTVSVSHPPHIDRAGAWVQSSQPGQHTLQCNVTSHPPAQVSWWQGDNDTLITGDTLTVDMGDLTNDTVYTCEAVNNLGRDTMTVTVSRRPGPPSLHYNISTMSFSVSSDVPVNKFFLETQSLERSLSKETVTAKQVDNKDLWLGHFPLDENMDKVRVSASNQFGAGTYSQWINVDHKSTSTSHSNVIPRVSMVLMSIMSMTILNCQAKVQSKSSPTPNS